MTRRDPRKQKPTRRPPPPPDRGPPAGEERLQKVLAAAGLGSRRQCEELIRTGRVEVDRKTVTELGTKVDPSQHEIRVDGTPVNRARSVYYVVNKPTGVVSTNRDPAGRPRVIDLVPATDDERLFCVGRLDLNSEGLILLTNDGELTNRLTHPRYGIEKTYRVLVAGVPGDEVLEQLRRGVHLAEGIARVSRVDVVRQIGQSTMLQIILREGQNREIRRILAKVGHKVMRLKRIAVGPIRLSGLPLGGWRKLTGREVQMLKAATRGGRRGPEENRGAKDE